jgi:hypothetical protein
MSRNSGSIDPSANEAKRMHEVSAGYRKDKAGLEREFRHTIGKRTFKLMRTVGLADRTTLSRGGLDPSPVKTIRTSKIFDFKLPDDDTQYGLRFEVSSLPLLIPVPLRIPGMSPFSVFEAKTELRVTNGDETRRSVRGVDDLEYVNGTKRVAGLMQIMGLYLDKPPTPDN